jgi:hypothetical protein
LGDDRFFGSDASAIVQTVRPGTLTVTAANAARPYGAPNPALTGTVAGAVNGDLFTVTGTTTATATSPVGAYPVVPAISGSNVSDYTVTAANGTLTVTEATPTSVLTSSANPASAATPVTFTAKVSATGVAATGSVSFYDGKTLRAQGR